MSLKLKHADVTRTVASITLSVLIMLLFRDEEGFAKESF